MRLLGEIRSLDDIEQGLIRGSGGYHEPRVHFALNCASIGCPALRPEAYVGRTLDAQLDDSMRRFLSDRMRNRFEAEQKWYESDFTEHWGSLRQFLAANVAALTSNLAGQARIKGNATMDLSFLNYDWSLNGVSN